MGELYEPFPKLPKNIRQIGERDNIVRVYVEDYVNTYLKRLYPAGGGFAGKFRGARRSSLCIY